ncbi:MAG: threonylcarbamoyl-AMP synthase [Bacteroidales bacterium]|nr:threonylcarbamoyl-AMP synthase [Bacteroidales bacterium]
MIIKLYEENPNERQIRQVVECLNDGGVIIYPTDTLYGFGCSIYKQKAIERIAKIKNIDIKHNTFSIVCHNLSQMSDYAKPISNEYFRIIKRALPGPFTFILNANSKVPKHLNRKKKNVGIRIPDNNIPRMLVEMSNNPILSTSIQYNDDELEYCTNPELIYEKYKDRIDIMIDGGICESNPSTVVDMTNNEIEIIRQGKGNLEDIFS